VNGNRTGISTPPVPGFPNGRTTTATYTDGTSVPATDTGYAPAGLPWKVTTAGGAVQTTTYFHSGDVAVGVDAAGLATSRSYDNLGRASTMTVVSDAYPSGLVTSYSYDGLNHVVTKTDPAVTDRVTGAVHTAKTTDVYDADGNQTSVTVADLTGGDASRTQSWTYNSHDQQATATDAVNKVTTYGYDAYGNRNKTTDPAGNETDEVFDANGHLLTTTLKAYTGDPANPGPPQDLVLSSKAYDPGGRLASDTDSMGWVTSYTYTDNGLAATVTRSDPAHGTSYLQEANTYDAAGNVVSRQSNNGATTTNATIDAANRVTSSVLDPTGVNRTTSYSYSPDDRVLSTTVSDANGASVTEAAYDPLGRMTWHSVHDTSTTPVGRWKLTDGSGTTAADSDGNHPGAASSGVGWSGGHGGSATFDGTGVISTTGPVLDTSRSFTVSAWVYLTSTADYAVAVSEPGSQQSSFALLYDAGINKWAFTRWSDDSASPSNHYEAASTTTPVLNTWTHLTGVYDVTTHGMTLYVNGTAQGTDNDPTPFKATGPLRIGQGMSAGSACCGWVGSLSDVQVYNQALTSSQVGSVYGGTLPAAGSMRISTSQTLDQRGLPTSATDANGNITTFAYDEAGRPAVTTAPTVNTETGGGTPTPTHPLAMVGYDTFGATVETSDPNGRVVTTGYDAAGRPLSVTTPSYTPPGSSTPITPVASKMYNNLGQVATATDPLGHQSSYVYDQLGHLATVTAPNTGVIHYTYDTDGDQLSVTDPTGGVNQATYDYLGRTATTTQVVRQPSAAAYTTTYTYNTTGGWLSSVTTPGSVTTSYGYDHVGETTTVTDAASNTTTYSYDYAGRKTKTLLPDGTAATTTYDVAGRATATAQLDTDSSVLASRSTGYDPNGNPVTATDARGHTTRYGFDATNRLSSQTQPLTDTTSITTSVGYDAAGNRTRFTDGRGNPFITTYNTWNLPESTIEPATPAYPNAADRTFTTVYDADGRVTARQSPGGVSVTNTYDAVGNLTGQSGTGADGPTAARTFGYDAARRMTSASAPGDTDTFGYDDRGLLLSTTGPSGASAFSYNADGLMSTRTDAAGTATYTYDTASRLKTVQDPASAATLTYGYNTLSQLNQVSYGPGADVRTLEYNTLHQLTSDTVKTSAGATIASITYGYDLNGNETSKTTAGFAGAAANTYTYDFANRLTSWAAGGTTTSYGYDNSGNRTQAGSQTLTYNARNEITSSGYAYTARGTLASAGGQATTSDAYGQTITAGTQTYAYDALGRMITDATSGGGTRTFSYTGTGNTLAGDGGSTYGRDPSGALVGVRTGSTGVLAWTDRHTDVVGVFAASGTALAGSAAYDPLGKVLATTSPVGNLGYQSGWTEAATNRVNMAARWYDVNTGQFDNRDTVANSPVPASVAANGYAYGNDNPLTALDPSGHRPCFDDGNCGRWSSTSTTVGAMLGAAIARLAAGRRLPTIHLPIGTRPPTRPISQILRDPKAISEIAPFIHISDLRLAGGRWGPHLVHDAHIDFTPSPPCSPSDLENDHLFRMAAAAGACGSPKESTTMSGKLITACVPHPGGPSNGNKCTGTKHRDEEVDNEKYRRKADDAADPIVPEDWDHQVGFCENVSEIDCEWAKIAAGEATSVADDLYKGKDEGKRNAFRHAYWMALLTHAGMSIDHALTFAAAHELDGSEQYRKVDGWGSDESRIDMHNNRVGAQIGAATQQLRFTPKLFRDPADNRSLLMPLIQAAIEDGSLDLTGT
jgi:RHS repeat-associated protein